jgi:hypothetical protein
MPKNVRGTAEKDRRADAPASDYPFAGGIDVDDTSSVLTYVAKFNAAMADVQSELSASGLRPGMAGYDDMQDGGGGYSVPSPGLDPAKAGLQRAK